MTGDHLAIEASGLTKRYGDVTAVRDLTFTVRPGAVTGFLGPNGAGKTTTMRMLTGLVTPTSGTATIGGQPYGRLAQPARTVGAVFDGNAFHPGHTARDHLRLYAAMAGCPDSRVAELLDLLGLAQAADRRTRGFSTGMRQRLSLATALLGDPRVLLLDEPSNGLDPEGLSWLRGLLRRLADEGRTVLVSSHVLHEVQQVVDDVSSYLGTITAINIVLGLITAGALHLLGMPFPLMWGGIVALFNYIPYFGPVIAALLVAIGGLMTFREVGTAMAAPAIMYGLHLIEANVVTPLVVGHRLTINPVLILVSLSFWGWVWGTVGALLAVPLLIIIQTILKGAGKPDIAGFLFEHGTLVRQPQNGVRTSEKSDAAVVDSPAPVA